MILEELPVLHVGAWAKRKKFMASRGHIGLCLVKNSAKNVVQLLNGTWSKMARFSIQENKAIFTNF